MNREQNRTLYPRTGRHWSRHVAGGTYLFAAIALLLIISFLVPSCAINKATGKRQLILISESQEIQMGKDADKDIIASMGLYPDSSLQRYIRNLGDELAAKSERPNLPWTFRLVDDPVVNAFALPGGFVYITRGIMAYLNSEAELAGVMGHEIGHVTGKHAVARMSKAQIAQVGLGVGQILEPSLQKYSQLANAGLGLLFLKYSRDDETQADELGVRYMTRIGDDPRAMVGVMTMLDRVTQAGGGAGAPEWLATHPNPGNRRENIQEEVDTMHVDFAKTKLDRDSYLRRLEGLVFGDNPRHGYFKGSSFYHPDLKFLFVFPEGWQTSNQLQAVMGVSPNQDVLIQITLSSAATPDAAATQFLNQQGISGARPRAITINGIQALWSDFTAQTDQGALAGSAAFLSHDGKVYQLLAYGTQQGWASNGAAATTSLRSFARLTDPKALAVEPMRLRIVKLDRAMTLQQFADKYPGPVSVEKLALINRVEPSTELKAGELVKNVVGEKIE
jgi:predicted Zn-dependent protease